MSDDRRAIEALLEQARGGDLDSLERVMIHAFRYGDKALSLTVDQIAYDLHVALIEARRAAGVTGDLEADPTWQRIHEIGLRTWEFRNGRARAGGAPAFGLPLAGPWTPPVEAGGSFPCSCGHSPDDHEVWKTYGRRGRRTRARCRAIGCGCPNYVNVIVRRARYGGFRPQ